MLGKIQAGLNDKSKISADAIDGYIKDIETCFKKTEGLTSDTKNLEENLEKRRAQWNDAMAKASEQKEISDQIKLTLANAKS